MIRTAILVDGGFYRKRAKTIKGELFGNLFEHIDGLTSIWPDPTKKK